MEKQLRGTEPKISVVIPVRNRPELIIRCLESVKAQNFREMQVVVVDNGSEDDTFRRVAEWIAAQESDPAGLPFSIRLEEEPISGATRARNRGFSYVATPYVMFFDSDDEMKAGLVSGVMREFDTDPDLDMVCWRVRHLAGGKSKRLKISVNDMMKNHLYHCVLRTQCYAMKSELLRRAGGWNDELPAWNDWELGVRLIVEKPKVKLINKELVNIYHTSDSITGDNFNSKAGVWERSIAAVENTLSLPGADPDGTYRKMALYVRAILAARYAKEGCAELAAIQLNVAMRDPSLSRCERRLLRILYYYTSKGGRGAYLLWK